MRDREILAWCAATVLAAFSVVMAVYVTFFPTTETVTVTKTVTKTVPTPRTQGLKHLDFLDNQFGGVNAKGVNVTVTCKGYWDTTTPPLDQKVGAEDGQRVYNICTAKADR